MKASQVLSLRSQKAISVWTSLCAQGHSHAETGKGIPHTVATKLEAQQSSRFPFTGTTGPRPKHEKQLQTIIPPPPNVTVGTIKSGRHCSVLIASAKPTLDRRTATG